MPFNSLDKALLDRAVRRTSQDAVDHKASVTINGIWPNTPDGRRDKRLYDALNRDAGDLKALQQRMMREVGDASVVPKVRAPAPMPAQFEAAPGLMDQQIAETAAGRPPTVKPVEYKDGVHVMTTDELIENERRHPAGSTLAGNDGPSGFRLDVGGGGTSRMLNGKCEFLVRNPETGEAEWKSDTNLTEADVKKDWKADAAAIGQEMPAAAKAWPAEPVGSDPLPNVRNG